jgi:hypothetical protein
MFTQPTACYLHFSQTSSTKSSQAPISVRNAGSFFCREFKQSVSKILDRKSLLIRREGLIKRYLALNQIVSFVQRVRFVAETTWPREGETLRGACLIFPRAWESSWSHLICLSANFDVERDIVGRLLALLGHRDFSLSA